MEENIIRQYIENIYTLDWAVALQEEMRSGLELKVLDKDTILKPGRLFAAKINQTDMVLVSAFVCYQLGFNVKVNLKKSNMKLAWNKLKPQKALYKDLTIKINLYKYDQNCSSSQAVEFIKRAGGLMEFSEFTEDFKHFSKQIINYINTKNSKSTKTATKTFTRVKKTLSKKKSIKKKKSSKQKKLTNLKITKSSTKHF